MAKESHLENQYHMQAVVISHPSSPTPAHKIRPYSHVHHHRSVSVRATDLLLMDLESITVLHIELLGTVSAWARIEGAVNVSHLNLKIAGK